MRQGTCQGYVWTPPRPGSGEYGTIFADGMTDFYDQACCTLDKLKFKCDDMIAQQVNDRREYSLLYPATSPFACQTALRASAYSTANRRL
jgi:hypothetical protein